MKFRSAFSVLIFFVIAIAFQSCGLPGKEKAILSKKAYEDFNALRYDSALIGFNKLVEMDPENEDLWTMLGRTLFATGKKEQALQSFTKSIELYPSYINQAYLYRAITYSNLDKTDKALSDLNSALKAEGMDTAVLVIRAGVYFKLKEYKKQIEDCNRVIELSPTYAEAYYLRACAYRRLDRLDEALNDFNTAIKLSPNDLLYRNDRGFLLSMLKMYPQALEDYEAIIKGADKAEKQTLAYAYNNRGFTYYNLGRKDEALQDIDHSLKLFPENSYAYKNRAVVFISMNQMDKACADIEQALKLGFTDKYGDEVENLRRKHCN